MRRLTLTLALLALLASAEAARIEVYPPASCPNRSVFCSLADAADWVSQHGGSNSDVHVCLHEGVHRLREPMRLNASHSGSHWTTCSGERAVVSGGLSVPSTSWQRESGGGLWVATLPATATSDATSAATSTAAVKHIRTLWVGGVRANRTVLNASALLGYLRVTASGYVSERAVSWQPSAEDVELNYFQQLAPWQAQRCVLTRTEGHILTVAQPCFDSISRRTAGVPGLPRNRSSGRTGCADSNPDCGLLGNPLGSGLPMFVENIPLNDPGLPKGSEALGQFSFSPRQQQLWYRPHPHELSADGNTFTAEAVVPIAEGLVTANNLRAASFSGIDFEHMAWNSPSLPAGFVDLQDGETELGYIPGGLDCVNCSDVAVVGCRFSKLGGSGVTFTGVAKRVNVTGLDVHDVSGNGIAVDGSVGGNASAPSQCEDNAVTDCIISHAGQEYTGAVGIQAGFNIGLVLSHNTVTNLPYGAISVGAGAARPGYAHTNTIAYNKIARFMLKMVDSAGIYVTGRQPGSRMYHNFISEQGLTGLEPQPQQCDIHRCTVEEVIAHERIWIEEVDPTGHKYNITSCKRTSEHRWCNQAGNAHGGGIYTDNGSGGWSVTENVLTAVYHWMFTWQPGKMVDMQFERNWVDSPLYTNNAAESIPPVTVSDNTLVARGGVWPAEALAVMAGAGARRPSMGLFGHVHES